jgi:hypothetical protein
MIEAGFSGREDFRNVLISEDMAEITAFLERA